MPVHTLGPRSIVSLRAPVPLVLRQTRRPQILDAIMIRPMVSKPLRHTPTWHLRDRRTVRGKYVCQMTRIKLTAERLRELLDYCPETGIFTWRVAKGACKAGAVAGYLNSRTEGKRWIIMIDGHNYYAARLAFLWMRGEWPLNEAEHSDTDSTNDKWLNLRPATHRQNMAITRMRTGSVAKGVHLRKDTGKWQARIPKGTRLHTLGSFRTVEEAAAAYDKAALERWGEFARLNGPVQSSALLPDDDRIQMCRWLAQVKRCKKRVAGDPRAGKLADAIIDAAEQLLALGVERRAVVAREDTP